MRRLSWSLAGLAVATSLSLAACGNGGLHVATGPGRTPGSPPCGTWAMNTPKPMAMCGPTATSVGGNVSAGPLATPSAPPPMQLAQGIQELRQAPFSQQEFSVTNQYHGLFNGRWISIYAGAGSAPGVRVYSGPNPASNSIAPTVYVGQFLISGARGTARIVSVANPVVHLATTSGIPASFNLATNSLTE